MSRIGKTILWLSNLKIAISLLFLIAIASSLGTAIPQGEIAQFYLDKYQENPWLGLIKGDLILSLQFDQVYSSYWFFFLLIWLGTALMICSWRRQWPMLQSAMRWIDYKSSNQIKKLILAKTIQVEENVNAIEKLSSLLKQKGWKVNERTGRLSARKGVIGRVGPLLVHLGLILLMIGSILGVLNGQKTEVFLSPGKSLDILSPDKQNQLKLKLNEFEIQRDSLGRPEQFRSKLQLNQTQQEPIFKETSVNHPLRYRGITIYQADWALAAITVQIGGSPKIQLPLSRFPELGDQIWGVVIPTTQEGENPILISLSSEKGPARVFKEDGSLITSLLPGGDSKDILGVSIQITDVLASSGILLKRDPGVPIVYSGFAITLIGGLLSVIATRQLWAVFEKKKQSLHIGGLCNRNLTAFANELPILLKPFLDNRS
tara:strand:+ start:18846 stop:20138 length:1293 start_codon:yes stop_codon:yes gene_type:complete